MSNSRKQKNKTNVKEYLNGMIKYLYVKCRGTIDKKKIIIAGLIICFISGIGIYFLYSGKKANAVVSEEAMNTFNNLLDNVQGTKIDSLSRDELAIKVYNCTKIKGLANDAKMSLDSKGYIRVDTGSSNELKKTKIYIKSEQSRIFIKNDLNIDNIEVEIPTKYDPEKQYDVVILLGKDYKKIGETQ